MEFDASELDQEVKDRCVEQIEKGMEYCDNCESTSTENIFEGVCEKHMQMYATLYP